VPCRPLPSDRKAGPKTCPTGWLHLDLGESAAQVLNLNYMMQYQLANYHEAEHPDGYHFSAKLNRFVYKSVRDTLEGMKLSPVQMPMHRPAPIAEFQSTASKYGPSDDDGRLRRRV